MDDMQAIERRSPERCCGVRVPSEPVDDLAIFEAVTAASRSHRWGFTMFSALKLIAAGVIVALFGGFLLAGVLTSQQSDEVLPAAVSASPTTEATSEPTKAPTTSVRTDILPGVALTVEEVEPGVLRVVSDGVRDTTSKDNMGVEVGRDSAVWLIQREHFSRLGTEAATAWPGDVSRDQTPPPSSMSPPTARSGRC